MRLLQEMVELIRKTEPTFARKRTARRAGCLLLCGLLTLGRRWITRQMATVGRALKKPYAEYKLFSRSPWNPDALFSTARMECVKFMEDRYLPHAVDETKLARSGKKIKDARWMRDPMSPPFHTNFVWGIRCLQISALLPLHARYENAGSRGIPVAFRNIPTAKKPGKNASEERLKAYKEEQKQHNLSKHAAKEFKRLRSAYDEDGLATKILLLALDGAFCNRKIFREDYERTVLLARTRKDAALCYRAPEGGRRFYAKETFTPKEVAKDDERIPWEVQRIFHGGKWRNVRYKEVNRVLWRRGAGRKYLRLIVVAPTPYRNTKNGRLYYRDQAYLLCTCLTTPINILLQTYFDRWQIEVNHRDEKQIVGVGEPQVRADNSVRRNPAFMVASYALLLLAGLKAYGPHRTPAYLPLPRWRRPASRPSCLDLIALLREQGEDHPELLEPYGLTFDARQAVRAASA